MTIEEKAHHAEKKWLLSDDVANNGYEQGYIQGATDQQKIDIEKACEWFRKEHSFAVEEWLDEECEKLRKAMEE